MGIGWWIFGLGLGGGELVGFRWGGGKEERGEWEEDGREREICRGDLRIFTWQ